MADVYSAEWYETFLDSIPSDATRSEACFVERQLPLETFPAILDLCCGPGRHAVLLAERGYRVHGVDANETAIRRARKSCPNASFEVRDMRSLKTLRRGFDGVVNLWHSFGYFDDEANLDVLREVRAALRPGGRAIFDLYNRGHFTSRPMEEISERGGRRIRTTRSWNGDRQRILLEYDGRRGDQLEFRLYSDAEFHELCSFVGLEVRLACTEFDESRQLSAEHARMQYVVERLA